MKHAFIHPDSLPADEALPGNDSFRTTKVPSKIREFPAPNPEGRNGSSIRSLYHRLAEDRDTRTLKEWNSDINILLIFAALYSMLVAAFVNKSLVDLKEDYSETSSKLLGILVAQYSGQNVSIALPPPFEAHRSSVVVNSLWVTSFILSVGFSLTALLCKQWFHCYMSELSPNSDVQILQRNSRFAAFERWHVPAYISLLPMVLHISIILFLAGLWIYLGPVSSTVRNVAAANIGVIGVSYAVFTLLPLFTTAPFVSPFTLLLTRLIQRLAGYAFALTYAVLLFFMTVVRVGIQERSFVALRRMLKQYAVVVRCSLRRVLNVATFVDRELPERGETVNAEILSWLLRYQLDHKDMDHVVNSLSEIQSYESQLMLADKGADIILLNYLQFSCFRRPIADGPLELIPERIPPALSCLDALSTIESSTCTTVQNASWMGLPTDEMINLLLRSTSGHDRLRVLAASIWLVNDHKKSLLYRQNIRQHVLDYINGEEEFPDNIMKALIDALHPSFGLISVLDMTRLLRKYLDRDALPSAHHLHTILFNLYNRDPMSWDDPAKRKFTSMHFIAHLLEREGADQLLYLRLVRKLPWVDGQGPIADADLSRCLLSLLDQALSLNEVFVMDVLDTVTSAPDSCHGHDQTLLRLAMVCERQKSGPISRSVIAAIASYMESLIRRYHTLSDPLDNDVTNQIRHTVRIVAERLSHLSDPHIGDESIMFGVYVLSMASSHVDLTSALHRTDDLLCTLVNMLCNPTNECQAFTVHHMLQIIRAIVQADESTADVVVLSEYTQTWEQLAVDDNPRIRWLTFEILMLLSLHLRQEEYVRILGSVRKDIEWRLESTTALPFVDCNWRSLLDAVILTTHKLQPPKVALAQRANDDFVRSGIRQLLETVPRTMVCDESLLVPEKFNHLVLYLDRSMIIKSMS